MVLRKISKDGDIPFKTARAVLRKRMRRNFHGDGAAAGVGDLREQFLEVERLRRSARRGEKAFANLITHGADQSTAQTGLFANVLNQKRSGRLAIRARDARKLHDDSGGARILLFALRHDHGCAFFDCLPDEIMPVEFFAPQCHE